MKDFRVHSKDVTSTQLIKGGHGRFFGFFVNSTGGGTLVFSDSLTTSTPLIMNTITPLKGNYQFARGVEFDSGLYVTVGGTIDVTIFWA